MRSLMRHLPLLHHPYLRCLSSQQSLVPPSFTPSDNADLESTDIASRLRSALANVKSIGNSRWKTQPTMPQEAFHKLFAVLDHALEMAKLREEGIMNKDEELGESRKTSSVSQPGEKAKKESRLLYLLQSVPVEEKTAGARILSKANAIQLLTEWWLQCFKNHSRLYPSLSDILQNTRIWNLAYHKALRFRSTPARREVPDNLQNLREAVLAGRFVWGGEDQVCIEPPNETDGLSTKQGLFQDRIVQEVLLMILEPIFEARFSFKSHGFRPGRSAHSTLRAIRKYFPGYIWYIKGNASDLLREVDFRIMVNAFTKTVHDKLIVDLIKDAIRTKLVRVGTSEREGCAPSFFPFAPQELQELPEWGCCGALSPLLLNIYLDQLDQWVHEKIKSQKVEFIRYGTHFLLAIKGQRSKAIKFRSELLDFFRRKLGITLSDAKMPISHVMTGINFLDHVISWRLLPPPAHSLSRKRGVQKKRSLLSITASMKKCIEHFRKIGILRSNTGLLESSKDQIHVEMNEMLEFLTIWFKYADNRKKVIIYCQYILGAYHGQSFLSNAYSVSLWKTNIMDQEIADLELQKAEVPKHERSLQELSWMLKPGAKDEWLELRRVFSADGMVSRIAWRSLMGYYYSVVHEHPK